VPLYSYLCPNEHTFDELTSVDKRKKHKCPECGKMARQQLTAARLDYYNMGVQSGFPTAIDKWDKMHRQMARRESN
jgi:putative FmdB family regulatory protein